MLLCDVDQQYARGFNKQNQYNRGRSRNTYGVGQRQFTDSNRRNRCLNKSVPYYKPAICETCQIWGHAPTQCQWIHDDFPRIS